MKKGLIWIGTGLLLAVFALIGYLFYLGAFSDITLTEKETGPYRLAYSVHYGAYSGIGRVMDSVYSSLEAAGIKTTKGFGIYYDDPKSTPEKQLRSIGGCIIESGDISKLAKLGKSITTGVLPRTKGITAEIPFKGMPSVFVGLMRVYPAIADHIKSKGYKGGPIMEIYDMPAGKIIYITPILK